MDPLVLANMGLAGPSRPSLMKRYILYKARSSPPHPGCVQGATPLWHRSTRHVLSMDIEESQRGHPDPAWAHHRTQGKPLGTQLA